MNEEEIQYSRQRRYILFAEEYNFTGWYNTCDSDRHKLAVKDLHGLSQGMIDQAHTINNNIEEQNK